MSIITKKKDARVAFFIDCQNLTKSTPDSRDQMVDYGAMIEVLADGRTVQSAYVFDTTPRGEGITFHDCLRYQGFIVEVRDFDDVTRTQKEVDMQMGCRLLQQAMLDNFDVAVVVSGDRDFVPSIEMVRGLGKQVEVAAFSGALSTRLQRSADRSVLLEKLPIIIPRLKPEPVENEDGYVIAEGA